MADDVEKLLHDMNVEDKDGRMTQKLLGFAERFIGDVVRAWMILYS